MQHICKNCATSFDGYFCSKCGQKAYKKIDKKYITDEIQYAIIHTNKGFLYSIKRIIQNPGKTAREFIDGNRVNHYKPIGLLFILSGISSFISFKLIKMDKIMQAGFQEKKMSSNFMMDFTNNMSSYSSLWMIFLVPIFAFCTWLVLKKWGNNYYEHVVMNAYVLCATTLVAIFITSPAMYFMRNNGYWFEKLSQLSIVAMLAMYFWFFKGFYHEKSGKTIVANTLLINLFIIVSYFAIIFAIVIIYAIVYGIMHGSEELLQYIKPS